jgi:hypothetical protein
LASAIAALSFVSSKTSDPAVIPNEDHRDQVKVSTMFCRCCGKKKSVRGLDDQKVIVTWIIDNLLLLTPSLLLLFLLLWFL